MYNAVVLEEERCSGCRACIASCPEPSVISYVCADELIRVAPERCKSCGLCVSACSRNALSLSY